MQGETIHGLVLQHFKRLCGWKENSRLSLRENVWDRSLDMSDLEVENVFWTLVKDDLVWLLREVFGGVAIFDRINYSLITLISKKLV